MNYYYSNIISDALKIITTTRKLNEHRMSTSYVYAPSLEYLVILKMAHSSSWRVQALRAASGIAWDFSEPLKDILRELFWAMSFSISSTFWELLSKADDTALKQNTWWSSAWDVYFWVTLIQIQTRYGKNEIKIHNSMRLDKT